jgi:hypothetical protein
MWVGWSNGGTHGTFVGHAALMNSPTGQPALRLAVVLGSFAAVSVAMTWPLVLHAGDHVISAAYFWDAYTNTMLMGARARHVLGVGPGGLYEDYFFAPITHTIAFNENLFGLSLLFLPGYALTHSPLLAYNLTLLLSLTLSAFFTFVLVRRLAGSALAAWIAGVAFAFCPYAFFEIGRIQLVATQWIPLFFLFLHQATERKRLQDIVGLAFAYVMQVGTCLYYAMFMLPLAALLAALLFARHRPFARRFWLQLCAVGAVAGAAIVAMVLPYFATRKKFGLTRSEDFAQNFDGKLSFLGYVHPSNKLLTFMHHLPTSDDGAHEEIAFPGFTLLALLLLAFAAGFAASWQRARARAQLLALLPYAALSAGVALLITLIAHSLLAGALTVLASAIAWQRRAPDANALQPPASSWFWLLLLSIALFLGFAPFSYQGQVVRGLYYYLHNYVPGFDGIRKVSRQAVMLALCCVVLAGFGGAWLFERVRWTWLRYALFALLSLGLLVELRNAPLELTAVPAGATTPLVYRFIALQSGSAPVAVVPTSWGQERFVGQRGLAIHNYLALLHGRRTINGKSSWIPPITQLFNRATRNLPSDSVMRLIQILAPQFLVVHAGDMHPWLARRLTADLERRKDVLERVYKDGDDSVYALLPSHDSTLGLLPTPAIDERRLVALPRTQLKMLANRAPRDTWLALDGDPKSKWNSGRQQAAGDYVELVLDRPGEIAALDFTDYELTFDSPAAFKIEVSDDGHDYRKVFERPRLRIYYDQVYRPKRFMFRVLLPTPAHALRLRLTLLEGMPQRNFSICEVRLWIARPGP